VQIEIKQLNPTSKEINLTVETQKVDEAYQKYLNKAAKNMEVPGFRKGKAPLSMVSRIHGDRIKDYFEKDYVDEVFSEAAREHDIHFLMYPEVKELEWNPGNDMIIKIEIEHEPNVEIKQTEGLQVPFRGLILEEEVEKFIDKLAEENTTAIDVDTAQDNDKVNAELIFESEGQNHTCTVDLYAGEELPQRSFKELVGVKTGDTLEMELTGSQIKLLSMDKELILDSDAKYPCRMIVNSILRFKKPDLDDEFAKDMDFENLAEMRARISEDMRLNVEHRNIEGENGAIIGKIFKDNPFPLPSKTLRYIVDEQVQNLDPKYRELLYQYYIQNLVQEMTSMYIIKALREQISLDLTDEMLDEYIEHRAILEDKSVGAYKEQNSEALSKDEFKESAKTYFILRDIASKSEFIEPEEQPEEAPGQDGEESSEDTTTKEEK